MALEGTLRDFGLADILQLIAIQKKTGVLTLRSGTDDVGVYFKDGNIVFADSTERKMEDRLGTVLVKAGLIDESQLEEALQIQKSTLQRLGNILVSEGFLSQEQLADALQLQITQIVYRLFRWQDGDYHFNQEDAPDYDRAHATMISAQTILMEGVRMIDEWPILEQRVPSFDVIFAKADPATTVEAGTEEEDVDLRLGDEPLETETERPSNGPVQVSYDAARLYNLVDGRASVEELFDLAHLGEFETCRGLYELLEHRLIDRLNGDEPAPATKVEPARRPNRRILLKLGHLALVLIAAVSVLTMPRNPLNLVPLPVDESPTVDAFRRLVSQNRIERIDRALYLYFLENRHLAADLPLLVEDGLLEPEGILDPWDRQYAYQPLSQGYRVVGYDNGGVEDATLSRTRRFPSGLLPRK